MSLVCAVPSFTDLTAAMGQDVIVIGSGHAATRLRLDKVLPVSRNGKVFFRALLSGAEGADVRNGTHLSRIGDHLVRLRLVRLERADSEDGTERYEAHAQAHLDQFERYELAAV